MNEDTKKAHLKWPVSKQHKCAKQTHSGNSAVELIFDNSVISKNDAFMDDTFSGYQTDIFTTGTAPRDYLMFFISRFVFEDSN